MFKIIISLMALSFSVSSFSKNVELKIKMTWKKGEKETRVRKTKIIAKLGQEWEVPFTDDKSFKMKMNVMDKFDIPADLQKHHKKYKKSDLMITGAVFIKDKGNEKLVASPQIMTNYKSEAILEVSGKNGEIFEMRVTPTVKL